MNGMRQKTSRHSGFLNEYGKMSYSSLNMSIFAGTQCLVERSRTHKEPPVYSSSCGVYKRYTQSALSLFPVTNLFQDRPSCLLNARNCDSLRKDFVWSLCLPSETRSARNWCLPPYLINLHLNSPDPSPLGKIILSFTFYTGSKLQLFIMVTFDNLFFIGFFP